MPTVKEPRNTTSGAFPVFNRWTSHRTVKKINFTRLNSHVEKSLVECTSISFTKSQSKSSTTLDQSVIESSMPVKLRKLNRLNKRKQFTPRKSPPLEDPNFRGITFNLKLQLKGNESKITIPHFYSGLCKLPRGPKSYVCENADDKHCASCGTNKTPLWRDAEDGTPLCNACGIRYKKYRERCSNCWRVPRKDGKIRVRCSCKSLQ